MRSPMPPLLAGRHLVATLLLWLLVGSLLLLQFWPSLPRNGHEVALVLVIGPPAYGLPFGCGMRRAIPPMWTEPESFGFLGSVTSY